MKYPVFILLVLIMLGSSSCRNRKEVGYPLETLISHDIAGRDVVGIGLISIAGNAKGVNSISEWKYSKEGTVLYESVTEVLSGNSTSGETTQWEEAMSQERRREIYRISYAVLKKCQGLLSAGIFKRWAVNGNLRALVVSLHGESSIHIRWENEKMTVYAPKNAAELKTLRPLFPEARIEDQVSNKTTEEIGKEVGRIIQE